MRALVPEVVQTSMMDCGPASLTALLEGFGIRVSYGRLREACQTDVDGTSIDTLEEVANELGLVAEQIVIPADNLLIPEARALPALVVTRLPDGLTHFVVVWRRHGPFLQLMDPARGRRWVRASELLQELYFHAMPVSASDWREFAGSDDFLGPLRHRMRALGLEPAKVQELADAALQDETWRSIAGLDASVRMATAVVRAGALKAGTEAEAVLLALRESAQPVEGGTVPDGFWPVWLAPPSDDGQEQVSLRGAVVLAIRGLGGQEGEEPAPAPRSPELIAALTEPRPQLLRELWERIRDDGGLLIGSLLAALCLSGGVVVLEALVLRALMGAGQVLGVTEQRLGAAGALALLVIALLLLDLATLSGIYGAGRRLEGRLRVAFLRKIPRLADRYLQSRPCSDMAERSHSTHLLRDVPALVGELTRVCAQLLVTAAGIIWLSPRATPFVLAAAALAIALPLAAQPVLREQDLRARTHRGALLTFYLSALLGLVAVRTHRAEGALRREHESLLVSWARANLSLQQTTAILDALQTATGFALAGWLLWGHLSRGGEAGSSLLLAYWALALPALGQELALIARQYPDRRNIVGRLIEPLRALEEPLPETGAPGAGEGGVELSMEGVSAVAGGHVLLEEVSLRVAPGSHVAIVGASGAGKSTLVGMLLGWNRASQGSVKVDGEPLGPEQLAALREHTAWVDPSVQLWNRSLLENLVYGRHTPPAPEELAAVLQEAALRPVVEKLPEGVRTPLGEGGGLVSGGEGQRVRFGRALLEKDIRLAILDEPFRGLDRGARSELLAVARRHWAQATLLCVTHDVGETLGFDRVVVLDGGRIVEQGPPAQLARAGSRYRAMLDAEDALRRQAWSDESWRRLRLEEGRVLELEHSDAPARLRGAAS